MKILKLKDMKSGWYIGNFEPTAFKSENFEVNYRIHPKGEQWPFHYHTDVTEINLLINGKMKIQNNILNSGDIFIISPYEITDPEFLEDCSVVCVKTPSLNDKVSIKIETD